jgi:hypothetical protein
MSLIVQVNGTGGGGVAAPPPQAGLLLPPHRDPAATLVTQIPSPTTALQAAPQPQLSVLSRVANQQLASLTRITSAAGGAQHVVQHHPPPLRMVHIPNGGPIPVSAAFSGIPASAVNNVGPIRQILPQAPVGRPPQLPRSPVRQLPLSQAQILRHPLATASPVAPSSVAAHHQRIVTGQGHLRAFQQMKVAGAPIMMTQRQPPALAMMPHAPNAALHPSVPSPGMMPAAPNLLAFPLKIQSAPPLPAPPPPPQHLPHLTVPSMVSSGSCPILPPNTQHHQLFPAAPQDPDE